MKLDYFDLISPAPLVLEGIGSIKCPTLREIYQISYYTYSIFVNNLRLTPEEYYKRFEEPGVELDNDAILNMTKYDIISMDENFAKLIGAALNFFFVEQVIYVSSEKAYAVVDNTMVSEDLPTQEKIVGVINHKNYAEIVDIISQRLYIDTEKDEVDDLSKVKNKRGLKTYLKILNGRKKKLEAQKKHGNPELTLPNIISSVAAFSNNTNYKQIWDLTIYQLFDLFDRLQIIDQYSLSKTSVAVYGDKEKKFRFGLWNKNIYEKRKQEAH